MYFIGMQRMQSAHVQFLPNNSPSSIVCGRRWCNVSGNRNPDMPPITEMAPKITKGKTRFSLP